MQSSSQDTDLKSWLQQRANASDGSDMSVYLKMLAVGIPPDAVLQKLQKDGIKAPGLQFIIIATYE
jgi:hypothetical protein